MPTEQSPDLSLFLGILQTLEAMNAPYMIIGAFAGAVYGVTRATYDMDIVVDLNETHIHALVAAYPPPRYYADPEQMRDSIRRGIMFNIIDTSRGEKGRPDPDHNGGALPAGLSAAGAQADRDTGNATARGVVRPPRRCDRGQTDGLGRRAIAQARNRHL